MAKLCRYLLFAVASFSMIGDAMTVSDEEFQVSLCETPFT